MASEWARRLQAGTWGLKWLMCCALATAHSMHVDPKAAAQQQGTRTTADAQRPALRPRRRTARTSDADRAPPCWGTAASTEAPGMLALQRIVNTPPTNCRRGSSGTRPRNGRARPRCTPDGSQATGPIQGLPGGEAATPIVTWGGCLHGSQLVATSSGHHDGSAIGHGRRCLHPEESGCGPRAAGSGLPLAHHHCYHVRVAVQPASPGSLPLIPPWTPLMAPRTHIVGGRKRAGRQL